MGTTTVAESGVTVAQTTAKDRVSVTNLLRRTAACHTEQVELRAHTALGIRRRRIHRTLHAAQRAVDVNKKQQVRTACPSLLRKHQIRALTTRSRV